MDTVVSTYDRSSDELTHRILGKTQAFKRTQPTERYLKDKSVKCTEKKMQPLNSYSESYKYSMFHKFVFFNNSALLHL